MEKKAFEVGDEVIVWWSGYRKIPERIDRVAKVHKTGRFVLEQAPDEQWRPNGDEPLSLTTFGATRHVVHATPEEREKRSRYLLESICEAAASKFKAREYTTARLEQLAELLKPDAPCGT